MAKSGRHPGFDLKLPSDWHEQTVYTFSGPQESGVYHTLVITLDREAGKQSLREYARSHIDQTLASRPDARTLKSEERELGNGLTAYEFAYATTPAPQQAEIRKLIFIITGGIAYTITANFSKKTAKTIGRQVEKILESFTPID